MLPIAAVQGDIMGVPMKSADGSMTIAEIKEFASFPSCAQRYIRRSLDVAFGRSDPIAIWSRGGAESASITAQSRLYARIPALRAMLPDDDGLDCVDQFMGSLVVLSAYDLAQNRLNGFGAYRFLYERILGANARPWLPAGFCSAASLPHLHPSHRRMLLQSISEAAATAPAWSRREPAFFPEWVEKVDVAAA
jgi:hypothetical protein